jgi:8-oxo-dGTP diphosphatase
MQTFTYDYPRPGLTVDMVLLRYTGKLETLLIQRAGEPFKNYWAFPGGFVEENETADQAALRELKEETNLEDIRFVQLFTDTNLNRDPRGWTVSVVYIGFVNTEIKLSAGDDAADARWFPLNDLPQLAFDHQLFVENTRKWLNGQVIFKVFGIEILPSQFNLKDLFNLYNSIIPEIQKVKKIIDRLINHRIIAVSNSLYSFEQEEYNAVLINGFISNN